MIDVSMSDKQIVLIHRLGRAPANVERRVEARHYHTSLVPTNRDPLDEVPFQICTLPLDLGPRFAILLFSVHRPLDRRHEAWWAPGG